MSGKVDNPGVTVFHKSMALVKTHIILDEDKINAAATRINVLAEIRRKASISGINEKRFERYGVLTCEIDDSLLDVVRRIPGVAGVEVDQERGLSKSGTQKRTKREAG